MQDSTTRNMLEKNIQTIKQKRVERVKVSKHEDLNNKGGDHLGQLNQLFDYTQIENDNEDIMQGGGSQDQINDYMQKLGITSKKGVFINRNSQIAPHYKEYNSEKQKILNFMKT